LVGLAAVGLAAAASSPIVVATAASVLKLLMPPNTALKSYYRSDSGERREGASNSNNVPALSGGLFTEGFRKCSSGGDVLNAIKGATRLACLFSVVGIAVLGLWGELISRAIGFCKYCNVF
jgi:hypothetical protein